MTSSRFNLDSTSKILNLSFLRFSEWFEFQNLVQNLIELLRVKKNFFNDAGREREESWAVWKFLGFRILVKRLSRIRSESVFQYSLRPTLFVLFEKSNFLSEHHLLSCLPFKNV